MPGVSQRTLTSRFSGLKRSSRSELWNTLRKANSTWCTLKSLDYKGCLTCALIEWSRHDGLHLLVAPCVLTVPRSGAATSASGLPALTALSVRRLCSFQRIIGAVIQTSNAPAVESCFFDLEICAQ